MAEAQKLLALISMSIVSSPTGAMIGIVPSSRMVSALASVGTSILLKNDRWPGTGDDDWRPINNDGRAIDNDRWLLGDDGRLCGSANGRLLHLIDYQFAYTILVEGDNL